MIDERLIRIVVEEVLRARAAAEQPPRRLLMLLTGAPADPDRLVAGLSPLGAHGFSATLLLSHTAARQPQAGRIAELPFVASTITEDAAPSAMRLAFDAEAVVVPWLSLNTAAKVAIGVNDTPVSAALMLALLRGIPVVACIDEFDPGGACLGAWARPAPALAAWLRSLRERLESFGVRLAGGGQLGAALLDAFAPAPIPTPRPRDPTGQPPQPPGRRRVITQADVEAALKAHELELLPADGIWTPLAREAFTRLTR